jgi:hypothetical protein
MAREEKAMPSLRFVVVGLIGAIAILPSAYAEEHKKYGADLEGFDYPYEVHRFQFTSQGDEVFMAYMDVLPQQSELLAAHRDRAIPDCLFGARSSWPIISVVGLRIRSNSCTTG